MTAGVAVAGEVDRVALAFERLRDAEAAVEDARRERTEAIRRARAAGVSLSELAAVSGLSVQRISDLAHG